MCWCLGLGSSGFSTSSCSGIVSGSVPFPSLWVHWFKELKLAVSCPRQTSQRFRVSVRLIQRPKPIVLKEVLVDWFLALSDPSRFQVRDVNRDVIGISRIEQSLPE